jgi:hypothetical protein
MQTISKKQFETAVAKVLNGGTSKLVSTYETKPFSWSISKKFKTLKGPQPANSKFSHNTARGGKENDVYLVAVLAQGYGISPTKAEQKTIDANKAVKANKAQIERKAVAGKLKTIATANGFSSVAKLKEAQREIDAFNNARFDRAIAKRIVDFEAQKGAKFQEYLLADRVKISRIELVFDCDIKSGLF